jgi:hypothetical protein
MDFPRRCGKVSEAERGGRKKIAEKAKESVKWKGNSLFKLKNRELINICKQNDVKHEGTKVDLIKRLPLTPLLDTRVYY